MTTATERKIENLDSRVAELENTNKRVHHSMERNETVILSHIKTNRAHIDRLSDKVGDLQISHNQLDSKVNTLTGGVDTLTDNVADLTEEAGSLSNKLDILTKIPMIVLIQ